MTFGPPLARLPLVRRPPPHPSRYPRRALPLFRSEDGEFGRLQPSPPGAGNRSGCAQGNTQRSCNRHAIGLPRTMADAIMTPGVSKFSRRLWKGCRNSDLSTGFFPPRSLERPKSFHSGQKILTVRLIAVSSTRPMHSIGLEFRCFWTPDCTGTNL